MKLVRTSMLVLVVSLVVLLSLANTAWADWTATLQWSKVVVAGGGLSYSDEGPFRCYYDDRKLTRIEFYDWNGDPTGASIDFTGRTSRTWFGESGNYVAATTLGSGWSVERFAIYDRSGSMTLEWTDPDSLNPRASFMVYGTGRFLRGRTIPYPQEELIVYEPDGTPIFSVTLDSTGVAWLSNDGERLYVPVGCAQGLGPRPGRDQPELRVYAVDAGTLMYTLPRARSHKRARDADVIASWKDNSLTVYSGGVELGSPGNVSAASLSPNGAYVIGTRHQEMAAYRLDTMAKMWGIPESADSGEQLPLSVVGDNGVSLYARELSADGLGITVVAPTGAVIFEQDYSGGARGDLSGDGAFFTIERYDNHVVSYYSVTE